MGAFARLAYFVARRRKAVLIAAALVVLAGAALAPVFRSQLLGVGYDTPGTESHRATEIITERSGFSERALLVVHSERHRAGDPVFEDALTRAVAAVERVDERLAVRPPGDGNPPTRGEVSPDGRAAYAPLGLRGEASERQDTSKELQEAVDDAMPAGMHAGVTGNSPLLHDLIHIEEVDMIKAEAVGLPIAGLVLLVAFGSVVAASLPLLLALCGLLIAFGIIAGVMLVMDFNVFTESIVAMLGIAIGIDYALLVVRRFREERAGAGTPADALARTLSTAGRTVVFSGAILSTSLIPLAITGLPFFAEAALGVIIVVAVIVALTLTLLPALLLALGDRLDKWSMPGRLRGGRLAVAGHGWDRWARAVMRRPWPVLAAGVALLLLAAVPALNLNTGIDMNARAMTSEESVKPLTALERHFPAASLSPVEVVLTGDARSLGAARGRVEALLRGERRLTQITPQPLGAGALLISATPTVGVDTGAAEQLIRDLRDRLPAAVGPAVTPRVTGLTAETIDFTDETNKLTPLVIVLALVLAFILLLTVFRSPVLAVKAIVMNLLSVGAAFGLTVLVFQEGLGESVLDFESLGYIQSWTPITIFMLLFGLSMDYEVFMVTRMREEWERDGDTRGAIARGLARTGGVVTCAATIMVVIFASFLLMRIPEMKQMGFALAIAVLIDATIVRAMLVPAFMRIAGRWNWWMPERLGRLLPRFEH